MVFDDEKDKEEFSLSQINKGQGKGIAGRINSSSLGAVIQYDYTKQSMKVQPVVRRFYKDESTVLPTAMIDVPVYNASGGLFMQHFPIEKGDQCVLVSVAESMTEWRERYSEDITPRSKDRFEQRDRIAFNGVSSKDKVSDVPKGAYMVGTKKPDGMRLVIEKGTLSIGTSTVELLEQILEAQNAILTSIQALVTAGGSIATTAPNPSIPAWATLVSSLATPITNLTVAIGKIDSIKR